MAIVMKEDEVGNGNDECRKMKWKKGQQQEDGGSAEDKEKGESLARDEDGGGSSYSDHGRQNKFNSPRCSLPRKRN